MEFTQLHLREPLQRALTRMGYETLTPIQESVIPRLLQGESLIVQSLTGSGKTLAYAVPLLQQIDFASYRPKALILTPTRELAQQVTQVFDALGTFLHTHHQLLVGKQSFHYQREDMKRRTHVLIATPGRLYQHIQEHTVVLDELSMLVLDEADEMFRLGFRQTLDKIFPHLPAALQTACFSATYPDDIRQYIKERFPHAAWSLATAPIIPAQLSQQFFPCAKEDAFPLLLDVLTSYPIQRCILFVNTTEQADQLAARLQSLDLRAQQLHGKQTQEERFATLRQFREGSTRILVASNVAARGLDIDEVSLIVNYDFPLTPQAYIHRVGRSARMEAKGAALSFIAPCHLAAWEALCKQYPTFTLTQPRLSKAYPLDALKQPLEKRTRREERVRSDVMELCVFAGKSKKLRPGDLVGAICAIEGVSGEDIGVIKIQEHHSYVEILNGKGAAVLQALNAGTIKKRKIRVEIAHRKEA